MASVAQTRRRKSIYTWMGYMGTRGNIVFLVQNNFLLFDLVKDLPQVKTLDLHDFRIFFIKVNSNTYSPTTNKCAMNEQHHHAS